jgi:UMF1 family MFS transporter
VTKNDPKLISAWCFYDWANSVHSLVIVTAIFPIYFSATAVEAAGSEWVNFLGWRLRNSVLFSYSVSAAFLLIALTSPVFSAIADYSGRKLSFMKFFCYLGSLSCAGLFFFTPETATLSTFLFIFSLVGWAGSIVFYNSFLPDITTEDRFDAVSARGFSMGYVGSVLLLVFNLSMLLFPQLYGGISPAMASRISFLTVGLWWAGFAQIPFARLPEGTRKEKTENYLLNGFRELGHVLSELEQLPILKRFLLAYFFYNMGVQTVMYLATLFGDQELRLPTDSLITVMLILQLLAIFGAWGFSRLSARVGNFRALMGAVLVWIGICLGAYFVYTGPQFYALAAVVGLVMGGIQALSRSTYAKLIPADTPDTASYFSFYDVTEKVSIVLGTAAFGLVQQLTGSMRNSVLVIGTLFVVGFVLLGLLARQKIGSVVLR